MGVRAKSVGGTCRVVYDREGRCVLSRDNLILFQVKGRGSGMWNYGFGKGKFGFWGPLIMP